MTGDLEIDVAVFTERFMNHYEFLNQMNKTITAKLDRMAEEISGTNQKLMGLSCKSHQERMGGIQAQVALIWGLMVIVFTAIINGYLKR